MISGAGAAVPNVDLSLAATGAAAPSTVKTNASGVATVALTATSADGVHLKATTEPLPATLPTIYTPTTAQAARNGQRLAAADAQQVSGEDEAAGSKAQISMTSTADPAALVIGGQSSDKVTIAGALPSYRGKIAVRLYGPFRTVASVSCTTTPVSESSFTANGSGSYTDPSSDAVHARLSTSTRRRRPPMRTTSGSRPRATSRPNARSFVPNRRCIPSSAHRRWRPAHRSPTA